MSSPTDAARALFPGKSMHLGPVEGTDGIIQKLTDDSGASYILKCFDAGQDEFVEREIGMRKVLAEFTDIRYPTILDVTEVEEAWYLLMEFVEGDCMDKRWRNDPSLVPAESSRLGSMMGQIHDIPLVPATHLLDEDTTVYTSAHFSRMRAAIAPFLSEAELETLSNCHSLINAADLEQTVVHADFGPHQIIVQPEGTWVLLDFEFSMIGPFADDLAGAEVRMERVGFRSTDDFLAAYYQIRSRLAAYQPVRDAYKAYLLLVILSTGIYRDGESPAGSDLTLLRQLIRNVN